MTTRPCKKSECLTRFFRNQVSLLRPGIAQTQPKICHPERRVQREAERPAVAFRRPRVNGEAILNLHRSGAHHRDRREAEAKLRKLSMKAKTFSCLALAGLSLFAVLHWGFRLNVFGPKVVPMKTADVRQTLEKYSSEPEIQLEVDSLFTRFGDKDWESLDSADLSGTPGLVRCGNALSVDPLWEIVPSGPNEIGVPSHLQVRFGQHFHYQYILFFRTGSDLSSIKSPFEPVTKNVYFKP